MAAVLGMLTVGLVAAILIGQSGNRRAPTAAGRVQAHRARQSGRHAKPAASNKPNPNAGSGSASSARSAGSGTGSASSSAGTAGSSAATPVAASTGTPAAGTPVAAAETFYTLAAAHRYEEAWALADPTFRNQLGGYASFANGQALDRSITFDSARVVSQTATTATLQVSTTSVRANGTQHCAGTVRLERPGSTWLLHLIGINCT